MSRATFDPNQYINSNQCSPQCNALGFQIALALPLIHHMSRRLTLFQAPNMMRAIVPNGQGGLNLIERPIPVPQPDQVLVRVSAVGVNRADLLQVAGKYPPPPGTTDILGLEAAGHLESGEPVAALLTGGGFAEYAVAPKSAILQLPPHVTSSLSSVQIAAIPEAYLAAYHVLFQKGQFSENQTVLITAAASGVGSSAIQLAKTVPNASVIASASTQEKIDFCRGLGADHVVNYTQHSISEAVKDFTKGAGVDLVLDCVGAAQFKELERSLKTDGQWVIYGLLSGAKGPEVGLAGIVGRRLTVCGTTLRSRSEEYRGELVRTFSERYGPSFANGGPLRTVVDQTFDGLESTEKAFQYVRDNKAMGKVVVEL
eukprot:GFKZ01008553.1.p2 GENE.GFKZ01008553.1~~GFKZ01008553.1.p2  ORF type:complete len:371 (-),score=35.34 GFKZ01008553.1:1164-2276(-)